MPPPTTDAPHWPGSSALVVPVPALEDWVRARSAHYDPAYASADPTFAHAHVTLLSPFVAANGLTDDIRSGVAAVLRRHQPFAVRFAELGVFPNGVVHLVPDPAEPFRRITGALAAAFPAYPPYAGRLPSVRPHLTLDQRGPGVDLEVVRRSVSRLLPAVADVAEARLSWYEQDACRTLATWPLGS